MPRHAVLSLAAQAEAAPRRAQSQFEVLVRHLLYRFFHNDLIATDDEARRILQLAYAVALPGLLFAMFLFPKYHAFPPYPLHRPFWDQASDHYFFVMYSFVLMGAATVYEWDLFFPDLLDIFVLSILPIPSRRLFLARVTALALFLTVVLIGTSGLGIIAFPMVAGEHSLIRLFYAQSISVLMSGLFAAASLLALQGLLLNTVGEHLFRRITPLLQGACVMTFLAILLLYPTVSPALQPLLNSGSHAIYFFPPFWFLGVYERLLAGPATLPIFTTLARTATIALSATLASTLLTYPLAYRRRVRRLIEGSAAVANPTFTTSPTHHLLHTTIIRTPAKRATFHFIAQTVLRYQRQRVVLAMAGGLAISIALANMLILHIAPGHIHPSLVPSGIRAAVPIIVFWTVVGLRSVLAAPVDPRGAWLFSVLIGRPRPAHLAGARTWITLWAALAGIITALTLYTIAPIHKPLFLATQLLVAIASALILTDLFLYPTRTIPFTHQHKGSITDLPLAVLRYFILFPVGIAILIDVERSIEATIPAFIKAILFFAITHLVLQAALTRSLAQSTLETPPNDSEDFPQSLGLRA
jgi:hypothetical protein